MPEPAPFKATDNFGDIDPKALRAALIAVGFKDQDIRIQAPSESGLDVELPKGVTITIEKKRLIYEKLAEARKGGQSRFLGPYDDE
ncbi:hypothetical protein GQX73_g9324 [Xylaria multiplex]|uniref:Uncharacterized protein n=1 Tax=Xylaria multiplex TaxID=323545 RepID=A0A7C8II40_9PEZI|nr:hypothetical protein GQX73_g9324 [Xylaria multiplex]